MSQVSTQGEEAGDAGGRTGREAGAEVGAGRGDGACESETRHPADCRALPGFPGSVGSLSTQYHFRAIQSVVRPNGMTIMLLPEAPSTRHSTSNEQSTESLAHLLYITKCQRHPLLPDQYVVLTKVTFTTGFVLARRLCLGLDVLVLHATDVDQAREVRTLLPRPLRDAMKVRSCNGVTKGRVSHQPSANCP